METNIPDYMEPLVGWRKWTVVVSQGIIVDIDKDRALIAGPVPVHEGTPRITSAHDTIWHPFQALEAAHKWEKLAELPPTCPGSPCDGHVPHSHPKCGIYGFKDARKLRDEWADYYAQMDMYRAMSAMIGANAFLDHIEVIGKVALWGRIAEHEHGYRAQFAYPLSFVYCTEPKLLHKLGTQYGVPIEEDQTWKSAHQFDALSRNRYISPSLHNPFLSRLPIRGISLSTHQWWRNQQIHPSSSPPSFSNGTLSFKNIPFSLGGSFQVPISYAPASPLKTVKDDIKDSWQLAEVMKGKAIYLAQSFNLHKPIGWIKRNGLWLRAEQPETCQCFVKPEDGTSCVVCGLLGAPQNIDKPRAGTIGNIRRSIYSGFFRSGVVTSGS